MMAKRRDVDKQRFWQRRVARQQRSGLSVQGFCRREGLSAPAFYSWRRELARRASVEREGSPPASTSRFARLELMDDRAIRQPSLRITLTSGLQIDVRQAADAQWLAEVVSALEPRSC